MSARCFVGFVDKKPAGFVSINRFPHPDVKNIMTISRIVTLPDFQGIGVGSRMRDVVAKLYTEMKQRVIMTTSHPSAIRSLKNNDHWICTRQGRVKDSHGALKGFLSTSRITTSWRYIP